MQQYIDKSIQDVINEVKPKLREYLESRGIKVDERGFFSCPHPAHPDVHPSCYLSGKNPEYNDKIFHCFSCLRSGTIFTAAHWLENLPIHDGRFYTETLVKLCAQFGIPYKPQELSDDAKRLYSRRQANNDALRIIQESTHEDIEGTSKLKTSHPGIKWLFDRKINEKAIQDFEISVIDSHAKYMESLNEMGWTNKNDLGEYGLSRTDIFTKDGVILPIRNKDNYLVGFVTRNFRYSKEENSEGSKFCNSTNNDLYEKGSILYNYNKVRTQKLSGQLYIVEGYLDAVYLHQKGLEKVVAIGSTSLTDSHIEMLWGDDQHDIVLVFDADEGGINGTRLAIERLAQYNKINVNIIELPKGQDPDTYVIENGLDSFLSLPKITPFSWTLKHADWSTNLSVVAQKAIPLIAKEESSITRANWIKELSVHTSVLESDIRRDVENLISKESDKFLTAMADVNSFMVQQLQRKSIRDTKSIIKIGLSKIESIEERHSIKIDQKDNYIRRLNTLENKLVSGEFKTGFKTPKFKEIQNILDGIPYWGSLTLFAGRPATAKTSAASALALDILDNNPDSAVYYMSIDDNFELISQKLLSVKSHISVYDIKRLSVLPKEKRDKVYQAIEYMKGLIGRLIIVDATDGTSLDSFDSHITNFYKNFSAKKKLFILDNFHKLTMEGNKETKQVLDENSGRIKTLSQITDIPVLATVELRKLNNETDRPERQDMLGTNRLDYDADVECLFHNDYQINQETFLVHSDVYDEISRVEPIIEIEISKNKLTGELGMVPYKFSRRNMDFVEMSKGEFNILKQKNKTRTINFGNNRTSW